MGISRVKSTRVISTRVIATAAAIALAGVTSACSTDSGGDGDSVTVQLGEPRAGLVPQNTGESEGAEVLNQIFAGLVEYDVATNAPRMRVAESITSQDSKVWTVKLRPDYTFHNGEKVTSQSFVDAWNFAALQTNAQEAMPFFDAIEGSEELAPGKDKQPTADKLKGLKIVDDTTFTVTLKRPFSQFPSMLGYNAYFPLPKAFYDDKKKFEEQPIGNGPFQMVGKWEHNQQIKLKKYDKLPANEPQPKISEVTLKIYDSLDTAYNDLRAGTIQLTDKLPTSALAGVDKEFPGRYSRKPESAIGYIGFPIATNPAFANPDLRKAISMAIDREAISTTIFKGTRLPADDFINPLLPGYRKGACGEACTYNPAKAKELYAAAGGLPGNKLELGYNSDGGHKEWVEAVANQIKNALGIEVVTKPFEKFGAILDALGDKQYSGAFRMAWSMDYPSIENYLRPVFSKIAIENGSNYGGYVNEQFEQLLVQADQQPGDAGIKLYQQADDIILKELPYLPIFFYQAASAWTDKVDNVQVDAQGFMRLNILTLK